MKANKVRATSSDSAYTMYDFLNTHPVGVLCTVDPDDNPHGVVVYFSIDEDFRITFVTKHGTKKQDNLDKNNHVMLVSYDPVNQTSIQVLGKAEVIHSAAHAQEAFRHTLKAALDTSDSGEPPISTVYTGEYMAYEIKPVHIRMAVFARADVDSDYENIYETLDL